MRYLGSFTAILLTSLGCLACSSPSPPVGDRSADASLGTPADFAVEEATIAQIHQAMEAGRLTSRQLVELYLARIEAYDKQGPAINSLITLNPKALERADELDAAYLRSGFVGPLHGIPMIVKDNYDTADLPTTAGSLSLAGSLPPDDAFQVQRIRQAGAIVLAKSNMAEFAFSPYHTVGSALPGHTRNPYALNRVPAGSSGGTGAAVAANFGTAGLGTDTGNSIRGPSSHNALVGIRSTLGLTSRDGIAPLYLDRDVGGPMARTVEDAALILEVIAGSDPADPWTSQGDQHKAASYTEFLSPKGLQGARIGVLRQVSNKPTTDPEVLERFDQALEALRDAGAEVLDPVHIPEQDDIPSGERWCPRFKADFETYLSSLGPTAPVKNLKEVLASGRFHPLVQASLEYFEGISEGPETHPECLRARANQEKLRAGVRRVLTEHRLDAFVFPTWGNPPRLIGDLNTPHNDNSQDLSPHTGFPALTVPMGYVRGDLPVGLQMLGDAWSEPTLIRLAYAFEQATRHRKAPSTVPSLGKE